MTSATSFVSPDGVAFTDKVNWFGNTTDYENKPKPSIRQQFAGYASRAFLALFDRISDPQIPLTRQKKKGTPFAGMPFPETRKSSYIRMIAPGVIA